MTGHAKDTEHFVVPQRVRGLLPAVQTGVRDLACGENHTVLLTGRGEVWLWGDNQKSQLGLPTHHKTMSLAVPVRLDDLQVFTESLCPCSIADIHHDMIFTSRLLYRMTRASPWQLADTILLQFLRWASCSLGVTTPTASLDLKMLAGIRKYVDQCKAYVYGCHLIAVDLRKSAVCGSRYPKLAEKLWASVLF
eukprot:SAG31_NODE_1131_length_9748_cov_3.466473_4_plen_193_part_00